MTNVKKEKGQFHSSLRQRQAEATASLIVAAAKTLFLERGYSSTTIEAIAEEAGVAVSTVYAVYGSKRALLKAIRSAWHERSHIRDVTYGDPGQATPTERLEQLAQATYRQWQTGSEVVTIYSGAASADPEAAAELSEALAGRRKGMQLFAKSLEPQLRPDIDLDQAVAILQALCLPEVYMELVRSSGWSAEAYQSWLFQALKRELLQPE